MGGIYITARGTYKRCYVGIQTDLSLPKYVSADTNKGIKPEYILGFYAGKYGLDIGIVYQKDAFYLFYWSLAETCIIQGEEKKIDTLIGENLKLRAYLDGDNITCDVIRKNGEKHSIYAKLKEPAKLEFRKGSYINRELVIAADPKYTINQCPVYTIDGMFNNGFVTNVKTYVREKLNDNNSKITKCKEVDQSGLNLNKSKIKKLVVEFGVNENGYAYEKGTCDLS